MSDGNVSLLPDVIKSASDALQANAPETAKQADGALSTVVGFFNNVVLYPVKKANLTFKYKLEDFEKDLQNKTKDIPDENLQCPPTMIAGPTLEALRYAYDEEELREMYENLLASAMDTRKAKEAHPAFVDAIKQMSPLDARIFALIVEKLQLRCAEIIFSIVETNQRYLKAMPKYFVEELYDFADPFIVSASISNLERLGLIQIHLMQKMVHANYETIKSHPYVLEREKLFKTFGEEFIIELSGHTIMVNDYGKQFAKVCLLKEI